MPFTWYFLGLPNGDLPFVGRAESAVALRFASRRPLPPLQRPCSSSSPLAWQRWRTPERHRARVGLVRTPGRQCSIGADAW